MATGLERSSISFRRQGSSGLNWDNKSLNRNRSKSHIESSEGWLKEEEEEKAGHRSELRLSRSVGSIGMMQWSGSNGSGQKKISSSSSSSSSYRATRASPPRIDPPSPKVRGCGFFGIFRKPVADRSCHGHRVRNNSITKKRKS
ncbi:uncharacterized protein At1g15400-like [Punica granatum]|uniref:Uncharacterized protein n=2 Tax=Punica granatum TaxID=22663 RepID=A0A2I0L4V4_PUNGR|nr:uncharacterized protein At1g15400-like [Punica granatum]PKI75727.1 hypothetical protein CRG98_003870 [Punica granatum]